MTDSVSRRPKAVVLLSGGLDSSTVLAIAREQGFEPYLSASGTGNAPSRNSLQPRWLRELSAPRSTSSPRYPDCRPEYIAAYETMADLATKAGVEGTQKLKIHAPLISLTKAQTIQGGLRLGVDYAQTSSCYEPGEDGKPCGACDSCLLRAKGFAEAGVSDPLTARFSMA